MKIKSLICLKSREMANRCLNENKTTLDSLYKIIVQTTNEINDFLITDFMNNEYITDYERCRIKQICSQLDIIKDLLSILFDLIRKFKNSASNENFKFYIDLIVINCMLKIRNYIKDPLSYFPDISLWFLFNNEPVGVCTIKAEDLVWSNDPYKKGQICEKMIYTDVKVNFFNFLQS